MKIALQHTERGNKVQVFVDGTHVGSLHLPPVGGRWVAGNRLAKWLGGGRRAWHNLRDAEQAVRDRAEELAKG